LQLAPTLLHWRLLYDYGIDENDFNLSFESFVKWWHFFLYNRLIWYLRMTTYNLLGSEFCSRPWLFYYCFRQRLCLL
jgi:hypothetical protein